jgi:hypothetical protein
VEELIERPAGRRHRDLRQRDPQRDGQVTLLLREVVRIEDEPAIGVERLGAFLELRHRDRAS